MFKPVSINENIPQDCRFSISFEGQIYQAISGDTVGAALLRANHLSFRQASPTDARGPYCMMGICFECLVVIDGKPNQQACQTMARAGMEIERQMMPDLTSSPKPTSGKEQ